MFFKSGRFIKGMHGFSIPRAASSFSADDHCFKNLEIKMVCLLNST